MTRPSLVLVGGGHSHVQVLRAHLMRPLPVELTVVVDQPVAVYSGMVPGYVAGQYPAHALEIDVRPLARKAGARVVVAAAQGIDPSTRQVHLRGRPPLTYDLCSLNVGSTVRGLEVPGVREHALPTRPIAALVRHIDHRVQDLAGQPARVVVVGSGAAGVELACCVGQRLRAAGCDPVEVTLVGREAWPLPDRGEAVGRRVLQQVQARGVRYLAGAEVTEVRADAVLLADGRTLPSDLTLWVTGAEGPRWLEETGLPVDKRGFVRVADTLEVGDGLFAVGDCAVPRSWPEIPKAGVYAVREGPVLVDNLRRRLAGRPLRPYRPQSDYLMLLNFGDGTALGAKWGLTFTGPWAWRWKDRIDRRFMERFQVLGPQGAPSEAFTRGMGPMPEMDAVCGGCAAKVGQGPLQRALHRLPQAPADPSVVLGLDQGDDVVAVEVGSRTVVANIDAFTTFTRDPWLVGRIAAVNATSDLYAKGATPLHAMALVTVPAEADPEETLFQVLSGARVALDADGVTLLGGHTTVGAELTVGFAVAGEAVDAPWRHEGLRVGDALVLTRALGTGVLWHADMAGRARGPWMEATVARMVRGNRVAAEVARRFAPTAATDVTGFGLAGHLGPMLRASGVSATIRLSALPVLPGAVELLGQGERSTFHAQNREALRALAVDGEARGPALELLFDPQTAGGLLLGVAGDRAADLVGALREAGERDAAVIGEVVGPRGDGALFGVVP